jgi:hypothetical protein
VIRITPATAPSILKDPTEEDLLYAGGPVHLYAICLSLRGAVLHKEKRAHLYPYLLPQYASYSLVTELQIYFALLNTQYVPPSKAIVTKEGENGEIRFVYQAITTDEKVQMDFKGGFWSAYGANLLTYEEAETWANTPMSVEENEARPVMILGDKKRKRKAPENVFWPLGNEGHVHNLMATRNMGVVEYRREDGFKDIELAIEQQVANLASTLEESRRGGINNFHKPLESMNSFGTRLAVKNNGKTYKPMERAVCLILFRGMAALNLVRNYAWALNYPGRSEVTGASLGTYDLREEGRTVGEGVLCYHSLDKGMTDTLISQEAINTHNRKMIDDGVLPFLPFAIGIYRQYHGHQKGTPSGAKALNVMLHHSLLRSLSRIMQYHFPSLPAQDLPVYSSIPSYNVEKFRQDRLASYVRRGEPLLKGSIQMRRLNEALEKVEEDWGDTLRIQDAIVSQQLAIISM